MAQSAGILVKVRGNGAAFGDAASRSLGLGGAEIEQILSVPPSEAAIGLAPAAGSTWFRIGAKGTSTRNPWDEAYALLSQAQGFGLDGDVGIEAAEPDWVQEWPTQPPSPGGVGMAAAADPCVFADQDGSSGRAKGQGNAWNFGADFSQLSAARAKVGANQKRIRIAHIDTGYDPQHRTLPENIELDLQRSFVRGEPSNSAVDLTPANGGPLTNRGHGTATLSLLAGNRLDGSSLGWPGFTDYVGGAPLAKIVPIRIANGVAHFTTSSMVAGFNYALSIDAHVLSMSMGGLSSDLLVDVVNLAYDSGLTMVTAAGNHFSHMPNPTTIVFPARFRRVLAACGVMANGEAYSGLAAGTMQGSYAPDSKMDTALGAFTPNVPWAQIGCSNTVHMWGTGTSSATPQVAAAAALWLAEHWDVVSAYPEAWMRVEAVRLALFLSAAKSTQGMSKEETREKIGQGVIKAQAALAVQPAARNQLKKLPPAKASWPWLDLLTGGGVSIANTSDGRLAMLRLELTQMAQRVASIDAAIDDPDRPAAEIPVDARNRYLERALDEGTPSKPLRQLLEHLLSRPQAAPQEAPPAKPIKRRLKTPPTPKRRLRVYALDPSFAQSNEFFVVNQTTLSVPWDDRPETARELRPGPVGEYLEVVDVDPASDKIYDPVDLNDPTLLAQDGWAPSEGNPQFHQQMVYAVGMTTIGHFEQALGRKALWAPRFDRASGKQQPVDRLRIYPHALRTDNAYYSPDKRALLFGYFPATSDSTGTVAPGSMVFSCLSSDIIAHEMSHALLDGLHRRFTEASNPDVPAFHEAFADIVAIFQHFTVRELVHFEIGRAHGELSAANLLGGLASQFGEGSGRRGPLRNYTDPLQDKKDYASTPEAHDRGSILVFAVYDAFLKIVARRTSDLRRLATNGTGILAPGALNPDLVNRLTDETCKVARHLLHICIRALDYCPAVDITFGEYLRGMITADVDTMPDDPHGYRVALIEAFRNRRILPRDVRTVSEESLTWNTFYDPRPAWLPDLLAELDLSWNLDTERSHILKINEANRWAAWRKLNKIFKVEPELLAQFGLQPDVPRYNAGGEVIASKNKDGATTFDLYGIRPTRRIAEDGSFRTEIVAVIQQQQPFPLDGKNFANGYFWFRGGATVIIDPRKGREAIRYSIIKNSSSRSRQDRQRTTASAHSMSPLRSLYFGEQRMEPFALMHAKVAED
jgi:subtilisin family serine protease